MTLNIVFGWHLDGYTYPEACSGNDFNFGGLVVGPAGLAQQLALRLGLISPFLPQAVRIARYMNTLKACDDANQFYSQSFALDPWSTASCILVMRDQLISAGWDGKEIMNGSPKLQSISRVEQTAYPLGCPAETLRAILQKLRGGKVSRLPIGSLRLTTRLDLLPQIWQEILSHLANAGVKVTDISTPPTFDETTDLGKIQSFLVSGKKAKLQNDGSFCLLEADDEYQLAEVASAWLCSQETDLKDLVILRDSPTPIIDAFCNRYGLPRLGGHDRSPWRTALQVLPLMLENCWLPANPYRTLELISLPQGPIPRTLSYHFVQALRAEPGFGGEKWAKAWSDVKERLKTELANKIQNADEVEGVEDVNETATADEVTKEISRTVQNLRFWLEPKRHDPINGMPVDQVIEICRYVGRWASTNARQDGASEMFLQAANAAQELEETLASAGMSTINKIQLDRILDAVSGEGCKPEKWHAQAANWSLVDHPGQIWAPAQSLLWWGFTAQNLSQFQFDPWTPAEIRGLADQGVHLDRPALAVMREAFTWRQALLNVQKDILLCRPRVQNGEAAPVHPIWHELEDMVSESNRTVIAQAHLVLTKPEAQVGRYTLQLQAVQDSSPPKPNRYWSAPVGAISQRPEESVSSISKLLSCPMAWVLEYHAQLHSGILLSLPDSDKLIGDIGHKLFRQIFDGQRLPDAEVEAAAETIFDQLAESVGLPLLLAGRDTEKQFARKRLALAARQFSKFLTDAELEVVACESHKEREFGEGKFRGDIDVLLKDRADKSIVIDYKWNKESKYKIAEIEKSQHLQLAAYAWLESLDTGAFPHVGYYMLRQRRLIHCGEGALSIGQQIDSLPLDEIWRRTETAYTTAMTALKEGSICATGIAADATLNGGDYAYPVLPISFEPPCRLCDKGNICGMKRVSDD